MSNDDKLSLIIRSLSLTDSSLEHLITNHDELTLVLDLAENYGLMITHNNGLYSLENNLKILDKSIIYKHLELLNSEYDIELSIKDFVNTTTEEFNPREIKSNELKISIAEFQKQVEKAHPIVSANTNKPVSKPKNSELTLIVAAGENDAIGKDNQLIWHLSDDLKRFKALTNGHHIIMGRKTFESFPKPLPNRTHVIITRQKDYNVPEGCIVVSSLKKAIEICPENEENFIIGGGQIYKQSIGDVDKVELTRVHTTIDADTFFPEIDLKDWRLIAEEFHPKDEKHQYDFTYLTYVKV